MAASVSSRIATNLDLILFDMHRTVFVFAQIRSRTLSGFSLELNNMLEFCIE